MFAGVCLGVFVRCWFPRLCFVILGLVFCLYLVFWQFVFAVYLVLAVGVIARLDCNFGLVQHDVLLGCHWLAICWFVVF